MGQHYHHQLSALDVLCDLSRGEFLHLYLPTLLTVLLFCSGPGIRCEAQPWEPTHQPPSSPTAGSPSVPLTLPSHLSPGPALPVSLAYPRPVGEMFILLSPLLVTFFLFHTGPQEEKLAGRHPSLSPVACPAASVGPQLCLHGQQHQGSAWSLPTPLGAQW